MSEICWNTLIFVPSTKPTNCHKFTTGFYSSLYFDIRMGAYNVLKEIGLSDGETKVYLALLKRGSSRVAKIKDETKLHRTTIYDFLEKLQKKGLVSYVVKNNVKYYTGTEPEKLIDYLNEKRLSVENVLPELLKMRSKNIPSVSVEVYEGVEGIKTVLNDIIRNGENVYGSGIDENKWHGISKQLMTYYFRKLEERNIKEKLLTLEGSPYKNSKVSEYKYLPKDSFNLTATLLYKNKVVNIIWEPLTAIMITSDALHDSCKKHFDILWKHASKTNKISKK
jgi:HTH-type transcriptional regulator, sugar sensing transcriptional regulator